MAPRGERGPGKATTPAGKAGEVIPQGKMAIPHAEMAIPAVPGRRGIPRWSKRLPPARPGKPRRWPGVRK